MPYDMYDMYNDFLREKKVSFPYAHLPSKAIKPAPAYIEMKQTN